MYTPLFQFFSKRQLHFPRASPLLSPTPLYSCTLYTVPATRLDYGLDDYGYLWDVGWMWECARIKIKTIERPQRRQTRLRTRARSTAREMSVNQFNIIFLSNTSYQSINVLALAARRRRSARGASARPPPRGGARPTKRRSAPAAAAHRAPACARPRHSAASGPCRGSRPVRGRVGVRVS